MVEDGVEAGSFLLEVSGRIWRIERRHVIIIICLPKLWQPRLAENRRNIQIFK